MKVTLLSQKEFHSIVLPKKCAGCYWIRGRDRTGKLAEIVSVEAVREFESEQNSHWVLKSNRRFKVMDDSGHAMQSVAVSPLKLYRVESADQSLKFVLYTEPLSEDRKRYSAYEFTGKQVKLTIGRSRDNHIVYTNEFVSRHHAELTISNGAISVRDLVSNNHTYVNGKAVRQAQLNNGDVIYVMGLQIVVTSRYLFLNHPDGNVSIQSGDLREYHAPVFPSPEDAEHSEEEEDNLAVDYYYRAPRFKHDVETYELKLDAPPSNQNKDEMPMIMLIGPSMTMGMASIATGLYSVTTALSRGDITSAIPSIVMSLSMLLGTLMWPLITRSYQRRQRRRQEAKRQEMYKSYLMQMNQQVEQEIARQEDILRSNDMPLTDRVAKILSPSPLMWERTGKHSDFLSLRLGSGRLPMRADIRCPERRFSIDDDNLTESLYQFGEMKRWLNNVPVCLSLAERFISGVYASRQQLLSYARDLILQIVSLHGYDEVKIALIYDDDDAEQFSFTHWLPHTMDHDRTARYIATNPDEVKRLSAALDQIIEYRKGLGTQKAQEEKPYFVVICLDKRLTSQAECVGRILEYKDNLNFSVLSLFDRLQDLPKECSAVVEVRSDATGSLTLIDETSNEPVIFQLDPPQPLDIRKVTRILANTEINIGGLNYALPPMYTFFEMLDIGMVEHLNIVNLWSANDPTKSLAAVIGIDRYGGPFKLDLHEKAHGPHGLVAGMTGSGKSEFIISYILSMAVNYHPYEVAFILIDYKGGGMAKSFEHIPHTAGVITNLDGNGIRRSLASLRSELHRRERIFRDVTQQYNVSNIDIYKYQKLFREGKAKIPLPHLFIISDEFAELKKEQPDFMTELTSTARVGRSLGVHLILATQKPGGVVDDQIRSNSRFRVCLKVQDNGDSLEMLGRPEAADLVNTGRFYLQVGNNELFEIGQSAWAGAPYYPSPRVIKNRDDAVSVIDTNGQVIAETNIDRFAAVKDPPKQLDVLTEYIRKVSKDEGVAHWKMWLDPIPAHIYVDELAAKYSNAGLKRDPFVLEPIAGEYDDPAHQRQGLLRIPITSGGNVIVYGSAGNGKEMFIEAVCYSLITEHSPREVNLYLLDFGAEMLSAFSEAPHVGDVILSYETEKVNNLFKLMLGKLESRKKMLARFGGDLAQYNAEASNPEPGVVVVINNYAAFTELFEDKSADLNYLTREGVKYGIYFILTSAGVNSVKFSLRQNFNSLYCLQLNNPDDYSTVVGKTEGLFPEKLKGRGLLRLDKDSLFEFQTAGVTREETPYRFIRQCARAAAKRYTDCAAARVPVLPEKVTEHFLAPAVERGGLNTLPIGVEKETLEIARFDFTQTPVSLVLAMNQEWQGFTDALSVLVAGRCGVRTILLDPTGKSTVNGDGNMLRVCGDTVQCAYAVREIFDIVLKRNNLYKDSLDQGRQRPEFEPVFVVIQSISLLKAVLGRYRPEADEEKTADDDTPLNRLQLAMEKCEPAYRVYFVVAESLNALAPFTLEAWYKTHISGSRGIWVGNGFGSQYRINVNRKPRDYGSELKSDFGFAVENAAATLVKLLQ